ncbi:golgi resident protein gcp60 [Lynx pardinus]|uniref:Golgi resident protein gcp60 n=1 Tax=Lynx pardinus TaxID=191816 RepID=A0A485PJP7_LYNPA|nr:golgi resident protein gcp60 [Lynx pardinus]
MSGEKDGKAFHPTYEEKLKLVALHKQVLMGPYNPDTCPEVGFFDVLGNDRRVVAEKECTVERVQLRLKCGDRRRGTLRYPFASVERTRRAFSPPLRLDRPYWMSLGMEKERGWGRIRGNLSPHKVLIFFINTEQTECFGRTQTWARVCPRAHVLYAGPVSGYSLFLHSQAALQKQQEVAVGGAALPTPAKVNAAVPSDRTSVNGQAKAHTDSSEKDLEPEAAEEAVENGPKESLPVIAAPSMWTRPQIKDFKEKIRQDADSVITVGRGEVVTVRVPTHEEGSYLFWEFATDNYDIGFGVYFEWTDSPNTAVSVHVSESSDDDEEEEENVSSEEKARKNATKPLLDEVVPVYRRDCHEEVYAGSHQYPGRGVYLLKFDNSYSLWRSKSVYYRVYYTR